MPALPPRLPRVRGAKELLADRLEQPQLISGACDACTVGRPLALCSLQFVLGLGEARRDEYSKASMRIHGSPSRVGPLHALSQVGLTGEGARRACPVRVPWRNIGTGFVYRRETLVPQRSRQVEWK